MAAPEDPEPSYTVLIRVPFPRGDFVDPPPVLWDGANDRSLWAVLSQTPKNSDVNWHALAAHYAVSLPFLLQQAAYLYDRHFAQVRAQLRRVGASKSSVATIPGSDSTAGGEPMARTASGGRAPSSLSVRRASPAPPHTDLPKAPARAPAHPLTRSSSTSTAVAPPTRPALPTSPRPSTAQPTRRPSTAAQHKPPLAPRRDPVSPSPPSTSASASSSSSDDDDGNFLPAQSRMLRRPPPRRADSDDDDDDDGAPTFLPFAGPATPADPRAAAHRSHTSDSSASSSAAPRHPASHRAHGDAGGPLAGRRTAELKSPGKGTGQAAGARGGSDGTPSMGSSFSDLDDASVTQSALEEALMSNMRDGGGMASKMSTFGQAFRSRYL